MALDRDEKRGWRTLWHLLTKKSIFDAVTTMPDLWDVFITPQQDRLLTKLRYFFVESRGVVDHDARERRFPRKPHRSPCICISLWKLKIAIVQKVFNLGRQMPWPLAGSVCYNTLWASLLPTPLIDNAPTWVAFGHKNSRTNPTRSRLN